MIRRFIGGGCAALLSAAVLGPSVLDIGPRVEAAFWPVLRDQTAAEVLRTHERVCWTWRAEKPREAASVRWAYTITGDAQERSAVTPWNADANRVFSTRNAAPAGAPFRRRVCIDIPEPMRDDAVLVIEGEFTYQPPRRPWPITHPVPPVTALRPGARDE